MKEVAKLVAQLSKKEPVAYMVEDAVDYPADLDFEELRQQLTQLLATHYAMMALVELREEEAQ